jgi:hypothetical protein
MRSANCEMRIANALQNSSYSKGSITLFRFYDTTELVNGFMFMTYNDDYSRLYYPSSTRSLFSSKQCTMEHAKNPDPDPLLRPASCSE